MKTTSVYLNFLFCMITGLLIITGCSEVRDDFTMPAEAEFKVHPQGFENPQSENFHGTALKGANWNWTSCQECHGEAPMFTGGKSRVSCASAGCHVDREGKTKSVATCNTCHGDFRAAATDFYSFAPPRDLNKNTQTTARGVGAHQVHLRGNVFTVGIECNECHKVPSAVFEENHLEPSGANKVRFGTLSSTQTRLVDMDANPPRYNPDAVGPTCENTYCHGNFSGGNNFTPVWTIVDGSQARCGTCHGNPETGNPLPTTTQEGGPHVPGIFDCQICHWVDVDKPIARRLEDGTFVIEIKELHMNGAIHITGSKWTDW